MAKEIIYLTAEGYKKLKDDLDHMRSVERPAISAAIAEAVSYTHLRAHET